MDCKNHTWKIKSPVYVNLKKHFCPDCATQLTVVKVSKIVWLGSHEAEVLGVDGGSAMGVKLSGKVKVHWKEFECPQCCSRISVEEMKRIEGYRI